MCSLSADCGYEVSQLVLQLTDTNPRRLCCKGNLMVGITYLLIVTVWPSILGFV